MPLIRQVGSVVKPALPTILPNATFTTYVDGTQ
jgi:hypothetical protein